MENKEIANIFRSIAFILESQGVAFKPQAYERAALVLESMPKDIALIYKKDGLKGLDKIPSIGKAMSEKIEEYIKTGRIKEYEKMQKKFPVNIAELTSIEGIGPKMVKELYDALKIKNIKDLKKAIKAKKLKDLPGFAAKTEQNILQGIKFVESSGDRMLLGDILPYAESLVSNLKKSGLVTEAVIAGSLRRMKETIGDVDILITTRDSKKAFDYFLKQVSYQKIWGRGKTKLSIRTNEGFDVDIRALPKDVFGAGLQYFTGSKEHNIKLRTLAQKKGYKVSEYGVFRGTKKIETKTEKDMYELLKMEYIEPEMREDLGEIEAAIKGELPKLIPYNSLKGDLQIQTNWTDGKNSIEEMAREAKKQGLEYIAITDHTKDLAMTGGSDGKKLIRQMIEIDKINKKVKGIRILKGAEVNIRKDGTLDMEDRILSKLDVVGVSIHSLFKMSEKDMTERIIRAINNPHVDILFHPTGRIIKKREPYKVDIERVMREAKKTRTIMEINAFPSRLDLKDVYIRQAVKLGVKLAISSDAHSIEHLKYLKYGIAQAKRGWAQEKDIINTKSVNKLIDSLK